MAWIESHQKLATDPKMIMLAHVMGWTHDECIGKLHRFWWWCVDHCEDGDLRRYNDAILGSVVVLNPEDGARFVKAMVEGCGPNESFLERKPYFRCRNWWKFMKSYLKAKYKSHPDKWRNIKDLYESESTPPLTPPVTPPVTTGHHNHNHNHNQSKETTELNNKSRHVDNPPTGPPSLQASGQFLTTTHNGIMGTMGDHIKKILKDNHPKGHLIGLDKAVVIVSGKIGPDYTLDDLEASSKAYAASQRVKAGKIQDVHRWAEDCKDWQPDSEPEGGGGTGGGIETFTCANPLCGAIDAFPRNLLQKRKDAGKPILCRECMKKEQEARHGAAAAGSD